MIGIALGKDRLGGDRPAVPDPDKPIRPLREGLHALVQSAGALAMNETENRRAMTRAEWIAAIALALNLATLAFLGGVVWGDVQDHERRISSQEAKMDTLIPRVERIDANVAFLADQAREARERARK